MKLIHKTISSLAVSCLMVVSCGYLKEDPTTVLSKTTVYDTEESVESIITGIYSALSNGPGAVCGQQNEYLGSASMLSYWNTKRTTDQWLCCIDFTFYSSHSGGSSYFQKNYTIINRCNDFLDNIDSSPVDESFKNALKAEARFLRAVHYFYLVRMFGDVSLLLSSPKDIQETSVARTKYTLVYAQILDDLTFAEENMRTRDEQLIRTGTTGRAFNTAATIYKAAVYQQIASILSDVDYQFFDLNKPERYPDFTCCGLTSSVPAEAEREAWEKVLELTQKAMDSHTYSLDPDYAHLFRWSEPSDFQSPERVMVAQVTNESSADNLAAEYSLPPYPGNADGTGCTAENKNYCRYAPSRMVYQKWSKLYGGHIDTDRSDGMNVYVGCQDPRLDVSYIHGSYYSLESGTPTLITLYPSSGTVKSYTRTRQFFFKKYLSPRYNASNGDADYYMMRYANVYLMRAEAFASLSTAKDDAYWQNAFATIDELHARARGELSATAVKSDYPSWPRAILDGTLEIETKEDLIMAIMWERVFELHGEGFDFYDTHRRGARFLSKFISEPLCEFLQQPEQVSGLFVTIFQNTLPEKDPETLRKSVLLAFPISEMERNPLASQNDFIWK